MRLQETLGAVVLACGNQPRRQAVKRQLAGNLDCRLFGLFRLLRLALAPQASGEQAKQYRVRWPTIEKRSYLPDSERRVRRQQAPDVLGCRLRINEYRYVQLPALALSDARRTLVNKSLRLLRIRKNLRHPRGYAWTVRDMRADGVAGAVLRGLFLVLPIQMGEL